MSIKSRKKAVKKQRTAFLTSRINKNNVNADGNADGIVKVPKRYLFTDWSFGLSGFKIYTSFEEYRLITYRNLRQDGYTYWFNIDNVRREIEQYEKTCGVKLYGLGETLRDIKDQGFSHDDKTLEQSKNDARERCLSGTKIKIID